jgi:uncharacterized membrane protein
VVLYNATTDNLAPLVEQAAAQGAPAPAMDSINDLPEPARTQVASLLSDAFSSTFVWALILLAVAFLPALLLPRGKTAPAAPVEQAPVTDEVPEPAADRG